MKTVLPKDCIFLIASTSQHINQKIFDKQKKIISIHFMHIINRTAAWNMVAYFFSKKNGETAIQIFSNNLFSFSDCYLLIAIQ